MALISGISFSALSATLISKEDVKQHPDKYVRVGTVSTSMQADSPSDAKEVLSKMADEKGGKYFVVTSGNTNNKIYATAIVYNDK